MTTRSILALAVVYTAFMAGIVIDETGAIVVFPVAWVWFCIGRMFERRHSSGSRP